jgi:hypothetical protein
MTVTKQGVKFTAQDKSKAVAFIDAGRVIRVYDLSNSSILAVLQLAQSKWDGAKVTGTKAYKQKCAEIAVRHGIKPGTREGAWAVTGKKEAYHRNIRYTAGLHSIRPLSLRKSAVD